MLEQAADPLHVTNGGGSSLFGGGIPTSSKGTSSSSTQSSQASKTPERIPTTVNIYNQKVGQFG
jgi:hypothetical protein